jgi:hypothetical protein
MKKKQDLEKKSSKPTSTRETQLTPSPRPQWRARKQPDSNRFWQVEVNNEDGTIIANFLDRGSAYMICRAVNSHDALVEALRELYRAANNSLVDRESEKALWATFVRDTAWRGLKTLELPSVPNGTEKV